MDKEGSAPLQRDPLPCFRLQNSSIKQANPPSVIQHVHPRFRRFRGLASRFDLYLFIQVLFSGTNNSHLGSRQFVSASILCIERADNSEELSRFNGEHELRSCSVAYCAGLQQRKRVWKHGAHNSFKSRAQKGEGDQGHEEDIHHKGPPHVFLSLELGHSLQHQQNKLYFILYLIDLFTVYPLISSTKSGPRPELE